MLGWARAAAAAAVCAAAAVAGGPSHFECSFKKGDTFELRVYLSDSPRFVSFNSTEALVWHERNLRYDASQPERTNAVEVPISRHLLANASLYAHAYVTKEGHSPDPSVGSYDRWATSMLTRSLVSYGARSRSGSRGCSRVSLRHGRPSSSAAPTPRVSRADPRESGFRIGSRRSTCSSSSTRRPRRSS